MTATNASLTFDNTSNATFRAWGSGIAALWATIGLVQTADTGQINWSTVAAPSGSTFQGYEIWRFADSLQATKPVFVKIEYGASSGSAGFISLRITVSTGTNGAGTPTGLVTTVDTFIIGGSGNSVAASPQYACGDTSSVALATTFIASLGTTFGWGACFLIERSRDANGTPNGDGLIYVRYTQPLNTRTCQFMSFTTTTVSATAGFWPLPIPSKVAASFNTGTDITLFPIVVVTPKVQGPALGFLGCYYLEFPRALTQTVVVAGTSRTYLAITGTAMISTPEVPGSALYGLLMRYE